VLVLDNCEHLVDEVARLVAHLLARCPGVRVLAASRETLEVGGERVVDVAPLEVAHAIGLFARRARAAVPGWEPDEAEREAVRRIVDELDGVPLALELAAARMRMLSAAEVADGLTDRFALLRWWPAGGARAAPRARRGRRVEPPLARGAGARAVRPGRRVRVRVRPGRGHRGRRDGDVPARAAG
jgi:predicted ATPase